MLNEFQERIYQNKVARGFNVTDVGKELILISEELGELCEAGILNDPPGITDAFGDLMIYGISLASMFSWKADEIISSNLRYASPPTTVLEMIPYVGKSVGILSKTYKKSNKAPVSGLDLREQFEEHLGSLLGYCRDGLVMIGEDVSEVLGSIIRNNEIRTHEGKI